MKNAPYKKQFDEKGLPIEHTGIVNEYPNRSERRNANRTVNSNTVLQKINGKNVFHAKPSVIKRAMFDAGIAAQMENVRQMRKARLENSKTETI